MLPDRIRRCFRLFLPQPKESCALIAFWLSTSIYELFPSQLNMNKKRFTMMLWDDPCLVVLSITVVDICEEFAMTVSYRSSPSKQSAKTADGQPPTRKISDIPPLEWARCRAIPRLKPCVPTGPKDLRESTVPSQLGSEGRASFGTHFISTDGHGGPWTVAPQVSCADACTTDAEGAGRFGNSFPSSSCQPVSLSTRGERGSLSGGLSGTDKQCHHLTSRIAKATIRPSPWQ